LQVYTVLRILGNTSTEGYLKLGTIRASKLSPDARFAVLETVLPLRASYHTFRSQTLYLPTTHDILTPECSPQELPKAIQHSISNRMTVLVVDLLEVV